MILGVFFKSCRLLRKKPFFQLLIYFLIYSDDVTVDPEPSWRQAFLIERGKMTEDRFAKIRHTISHLANHSISSNGSAEVPYRRLSRQELLAVECVKPKFQAQCSRMNRYPNFIALDFFHFSSFIQFQQHLLSKTYLCKFM